MRNITYWFREPTLWISVVALIISGISYSKSLSITAANLVFSEKDIDVLIRDFGTKSKLDDLVLFQSQIKNVGKLAAKDVHFKVYTVFEDEKFVFNNPEDQVVKQFDDRLSNPLQPNSVATFGHFTFDRFYTSTKGTTSTTDLVSEEAKLIIIYSLNYKHSGAFLPFMKKEETRCYAFLYTYGSNKVRTLVQSDFEKVFSRLIDYVNDTDERICGKLTLTRETKFQNVKAKFLF